MAFGDTYRKQVALLIRVMPFIAAEDCFALNPNSSNVPEVNVAAVTVFFFMSASDYFFYQKMIRRDHARI
jgi:hypothetical protein